ncbi:MAG: metallopeptidase TldD-related protein [Janthinobacterium lividum]
MNQDSWQALGHTLTSCLQLDEVISLSLTAEDTLYVRMTQGKIRQTSDIKQGFVEIHFFKGKRNLKLILPYTGNLDHDVKKFQQGLTQCRLDIEGVPDDPLAQIPVFQEPYHRTASHKLNRLDLLDQCLESTQGLDFVGLLTVGEMIRANFNSVGLNQWFESSTFAVDFSLYTSNQQAVKGIYGGLHWDNQQFSQILQEKRRQLEHLNSPLKTIEKGKYRVYFAPEAVKGLIDSLGWRLGVSQDAYQRGSCALKKLVDGEAKLSPHFTLQENFTSGETPPFNECGEIGAPILALIENGEYRSLLCSSRTAQEYKISTNFASQQESMRSPEILAGQLSQENILKELGTGLFVSNLHYLNWSNVQEGRITGMTRFGCFWVENGEIQAPVKDMRFDESLYHFWGQGLDSLTSTSYTFPNLDTYYQRNLGSTKVPGMIVNDFTFVG